MRELKVCGVMGKGLGDSYQRVQYPIYCSWDRYLLPCYHEVIRLETFALRTFAFFPLLLPFPGLRFFLWCFSVITFNGFYMLVID